MSAVQKRERATGYHSRGSRMRAGVPVPLLVPDTNYRDRGGMKRLKSPFPARKEAVADTPVRTHDAVEDTEAGSMRWEVVRQTTGVGQEGSFVELGSSQDVKVCCQLGQADPSSLVGLSARTRMLQLEKELEAQTALYSARLEEFREKKKKQQCLEASVLRIARQARHTECENDNMSYQLTELKEMLKKALSARAPTVGMHTSSAFHEKSTACTSQGNVSLVERALRAELDAYSHKLRLAEARRAELTKNLQLAAARRRGRDAAFCGYRCSVDRVEACMFSDGGGGNFSATGNSEHAPGVLELERLVDDQCM
ncbi:hypothetical protein ERJ75_001668100 [Trypanosoma vivax]|uniref:Uncharacterized protein n=1 Tax=Trypanosoma vivax (strain Y486) TaxID=1055687 RepID=G0U8J8_TRYVY|nr:hypothetical protein TRVL_09670 [Trypanosoma vivax]KAH8604948.1 hypothetical protein ERJ75_001668100 [Trypanosoma vivax]CCC53924.1 conserved hypothetical protein [Trypanosoma vivax Y486]